MSEKICEKDLMICNTKGLHARAAATFVKSVENMNAEVFVSRMGQTVNGDSIMGLMMLAAAKGTVIHIRTQGKDAEKAMETLTVLINAKFGEE
ncbi:MAG: HPr family phosphocarrier protein [Alphaproteobacteria bacterium]|nr:HPr family phosphocarrier protein [Alphaproteobacteria bacterium]MBO7097664.1 HPr family phosphocarrier protein [Alphaproteobacteria bacterium]